ncbi:MAG: hypothetical protein U0670_11830 [Anaerolineae bacterium]
MRNFVRRLILMGCFALFSALAPVSAQDASGQTGDAGILVADQVVTNGMVVLNSVTIPTDGWVVIHADMDGMLGHVVGIAAVMAGTGQYVSVMIDGAMSTPRLYAMLHEDTGTLGVFENAVDPTLDPPISAPASANGLGTDGNPAVFGILGIFAFDQQPVGDNVVIASSVFEQGGWMVIHADNGGSPGAVLGQTLVNAGTMGPVIVPVSAEGRTDTVYAMLHTDDNTIGTYEFGTVDGADAPAAIEGVVAFTPIRLTPTIQVMLADRTPLDPTMLPNLIAAPQQLDLSAASVDLAVDLVSSPVAGFVDVHNDVMGHPGGSLGHTPVNQGDNSGLVVALIPKPMVPLTPIVWPMLRTPIPTAMDGISICRFRALTCR